METNKRFLYVGVGWTILFAGMSFYWAMGGMLGVRSLGGEIYAMSLDPEPFFVVVVWLTGFVKLFGAVLLMMLLVKWRNLRMKKLLYFITKGAGILLFLYGLLNFITIFLHAAGVLHFELDSYATFWRLVFWEPFWMIGGVCYFFAVKAVKSNKISSLP